MGRGRHTETSSTRQSFHGEINYLNINIRVNEEGECLSDSRKRKLTETVFFSTVSHVHSLLCLNLL